MPYLACTPCIPLFCTLFSRGGNRSAFRLPGAGGDSFHSMVEPSPSHIRCRRKSLVRNAGGGGENSIPHSWLSLLLGRFGGLIVATCCFGVKVILGERDAK